VTSGPSSRDRPMRSSKGHLSLPLPLTSTPTGIMPCRVRAQLAVMLQWRMPPSNAITSACRLEPVFSVTPRTECERCGLTLLFLTRSLRLFVPSLSSGDPGLGGGQVEQRLDELDGWRSWSRQKHHGEYECAADKNVSRRRPNGNDVSHPQSSALSFRIGNERTSAPLEEAAISRDGYPKRCAELFTLAGTPLCKTAKSTHCDGVRQVVVWPSRARLSPSPRCRQAANAAEFSFIARQGSGELARTARRFR
jgi:hypothetical protein